MKIFSNFDTTLDDELYNKEVEKFGEDKVMVIRRDSIYVWFKIIMPGVFFMIALISMTAFERKLQQISDMSPIITGAGIVIIFISIMIRWRYTIRKLIDYYMDFAVISPAQIVSYQQDGLFRRSSISLDVDNIRSINEEKNGIIKSVFNYGTVVFGGRPWEYTLEHIDPDEAIDTTMIKLNYISYPRKLRDRILLIIEEGRRKDELSM
jgi:uncharacterized membrane protein YdbT with pleckstrin-like domain